MFTFILGCCIIPNELWDISYKLLSAFIAQSVECSLGKAEVTGSIPVEGTNDVSVRTNRTELIQNQSENKSG